jgi:hypothetical protein
MPTTTRIASARSVWQVDEHSPDPELVSAAGVLDRAEGTVAFGQSLLLRAEEGGIVCEVIAPVPGAHRCEEEFKVMVENAQRELEASRFGRLVPRGPRRWQVVELRPDGALRLWPID